MKLANHLEVPGARPGDVVDLHPAWIPRSSSALVLERLGRHIEDHLGVLVIAEYSVERG